MFWRYGVLGGGCGVADPESDVPHNQRRQPPQYKTKQDLIPFWLMLLLYATNFI